MEARLILFITLTLFYIMTMEMVEGKLLSHGETCAGRKKMGKCTLMLGLICKEKTMKCDCMEGKWVMGRCKLALGAKCDPKVTTSIRPRCLDGAFCLPKSKVNPNSTICQCKSPKCEGGGSSALVSARLQYLLALPIIFILKLNYI